MEQWWAAKSVDETAARTVDVTVVHSVALKDFRWAALTVAWKVGRWETKLAVLKATQWVDCLASWRAGSRENLMAALMATPLAVKKALLTAE